MKTTRKASRMETGPTIVFAVFYPLAHLLLDLRLDLVSIVGGGLVGVFSMWVILYLFIKFDVIPTDTEHIER